MIKLGFTKDAEKRAQKDEKRTPIEKKNALKRLIKNADVLKDDKTGPKE